jgi:hypothetical protein
VLRDLFDASVPLLRASTRESLLEFNASRAALLAEDLASLARDPRAFSVTRRRALEIEAFAWFDALLRAPEREVRAPGLIRFEGSQLLRLLTENPCELAHAWDVARGLCAGAGLAVASVVGEIPRSIYVFCRRSLLIETLVQVIENAAGLAHVAPGRPREGVDIYLEVNNTDAELEVRIRNDWTVMGEFHEGGLSYFRDELALFGADLRHGVPLIDASAFPRWTYEVILRLRRWNNAS